MIIEIIKTMSYKLMTDYLNNNERNWINLVINTGMLIQGKPHCCE